MWKYGVHMIPFPDSSAASHLHAYPYPSDMIALAPSTYCAIMYLQRDLHRPGLQATGAEGELFRRLS